MVRWLEPVLGFLRLQAQNIKMAANEKKKSHPRRFELGHLT